MRQRFLIHIITASFLYLIILPVFSYCQTIPPLKLNNKKSNNGNVLSFKYHNKDSFLSRGYIVVNLDNNSITRAKLNKSFLDNDSYSGNIFKDSISTGYSPYISKRHFLASVAELAIVEYIPFAMAKYVRNFDTSEINWTKVSPETWWRNLSEGWEYDGDNFTTNYFAHPYHGNLYFNTGRANGYNFWESTIYAFAGSAIWEHFGETFRPAFNDWVNTAVNGINFGESLFRLSTLVTDNTKTGFERIWREALGAVVNPVRGFNRLLSGESSRVFPNPHYSNPDKLNITLTAGMRWVNEYIDNVQQGEGVAQGIYVMDVNYGDIFTADEPFSNFDFGIQMATADPQFARLYSRGYLYGKMLTNKKNIKRKLYLALDYNYTRIPGVEYGQTSIIANLVNINQIGKGFALLYQTNLNAILMGGTNNDYYIAHDGRDYDMGPGVGGSSTVSLLKNNWSYVTLYYVSNWIFSMTEPRDSKHQIHYLHLEFDLPLKEDFAIGLSGGIYWRNSYYDNDPDVNKQVPIVQFFFSTTM